MYPMFTSCSTIVHVVAKRPRTILAAGLFVVASMFLYSTEQPPIAQTEIAAAVSAADTKAAENAFVPLAGLSLSDTVILKTEKDTCTPCEIPPAEARADKKLYHDLKLLHFLDLVHRFGLTDAVEMYKAGD